MALASDLNLQGQNLTSLDDLFTEEDAHLFKEVTSLNLEFNNITTIPETMPTVLPQILNLNNNPLADLQAVADVLAGFGQLKSLFISLTVEEEVDYLLKKLPSLEYLNGLAIDRDEIEGADLGENEG